MSRPAARERTHIDIGATLGERGHPFTPRICGLAAPAVILGKTANAQGHRDVVAYNDLIGERFCQVRQVGQLQVERPALESQPALP